MSWLRRPWSSTTVNINKHAHGRCDNDAMQVAQRSLCSFSHVHKIRDISLYCCLENIVVATGHAQQWGVTLTHVVGNPLVPGASICVLGEETHGQSGSYIKSTKQRPSGVFEFHECRWTWIQRCLPCTSINKYISSSSTSLMVAWIFQLVSVSLC